MAVLVLDNGGYEIKIGYAGTDNTHARISNSITRSRDRKTYIGNQVLDCKDYAGLVFRRPHEKGQLVSWETQKAIWDHAFFARDAGFETPKGLGVNPEETSLILTEIPMSLPALSSHMDQIVFEEYGFQSYYRCTAASLVPWNDLSSLFGDSEKPASNVSECALVVDSGFSATHVIPVVLGEVYWPAVRRMSVGGKMLTNFLKETVSFRHYNMMEDTYLMNLIKEATCYVSQNFEKDIEECRENKRKYRINYLLPDYRTTKTGRVLSPSESANVKDGDSQILSLTNERFTVPEQLFNSSSLGLRQSGLAETIMNSIRAMPEDIQSLLLANVVLTGGTSKFPGFKDRLTTELRSFAPQGNLLRVAMPDDPISYAWQGGCNLGVRDDMLAKAYVTKKDYEEHGANICLSKFGMKIEANE